MHNIEKLKSIKSAKKQYRKYRDSIHFCEDLEGFGKNPLYKVKSYSSQLKT